MVDGVLDTLKSFWMVSASFNNSIISPACHSFILFSKDIKWSFDFDFREGFCKRRPGINIIALNTISFNGNLRIHSFISRFPACPDGNKNRFFFQYTIFCKREIDFSQTNDLDNCPIYIAVIELKYMFDRLPDLPFFHMAFKHQWFCSSDNMI